MDYLTFGILGEGFAPLYGAGTTRMAAIRAAVANAKGGE
jgi:hypothetical protein